MQTSALGLFDWLFRDRQTGKIVIVQLPNLPLSLFIAFAISRLVIPGPVPHRILSIAGACALSWWAVLELTHGVNPFRRALGAIMLLFEVGTLVTLILT